MSRLIFANDIGFRKKWNCYLSVYPSVKKEKIFTYSVTETESCLIVLLAKKASKFRDWLDLSSLEVKPNSIAMEILSYLAYETVAQVTGCFIYQFTIAIRAETDGFLVTSAHTVFFVSDCGSVSAGQTRNDR